MKTIIKNNLFGFIIGALIFGIGGVYAATYYASSDVSYDNTVSGMSSNNVQDAIDELYNKFAASDTGGNKIIISAGVVTSGDGLYKDPVEDGRYVYKGTNPNNYIEFNNELWRIISIEKDGTIKIMNTESIGSFNYDNSEQNGGTLRQNNGTYCTYTSGNGWYWACNVWGSSNNMYDKNGSKLSSIKKYDSSSSFTLPSRDAYINTYLNSTYYQTLTTTAKGQIDMHMFPTGYTKSYVSTQSLSEDVEQEKKYYWKGNIGLPNATDYVRASTNSSCNSIYSGTRYAYACIEGNYMYQFYSNSWWTMTMVETESGDPRPVNLWAVVRNSMGERGDLMDLGAYNIYDIIPTLYLKADIEITGGRGSSGSPFTIG